MPGNKKKKVQGTTLNGFTKKETKGEKR